MDFPLLCVSSFVTVGLKLMQDRGDFFFVDPLLFFLYFNFVGLGTLVFLKKTSFPQALSLAFNLAFFSSVYWEIPIHVYTILYKRFIDRAIFLHVLYALPIFFVLQKVTFSNSTWRNIAVFLSGLMVSTVCLGLVILFYSGNIWNITLPKWANMLFYVNRVASFMCLCFLFGGGELKK